MCQPTLDRRSIVSLTHPTRTCVTLENGVHRLRPVAEAQSMAPKSVSAVLIGERLRGVLKSVVRKCEFVEYVVVHKNPPPVLSLTGLTLTSPS